MMTSYMHDTLHEIAIEDVRVLTEKNRYYGGSWKKRGGIGAFMMLARKWDRIENYFKQFDQDLLLALLSDQREENMLDDVQDLRRYLLLVTEERTGLAWIDIATMDRDCIQGAEPFIQYAWEKFGGLGATFNMTNTWTILENVCAAKGYDIFCWRDNVVAKNINDAVQDLRRQLYRLEFEFRKRVKEQPGPEFVYKYSEDHHDKTGMDSPFGFNAAEEIIDGPKKGSEGAEGT